MRTINISLGLYNIDERFVFVISPRRTIRFITNETYVISAAYTYATALPNGARGERVENELYRAFDFPVAIKTERTFHILYARMST